ncbi:MAG: NAD(P)-dependent alcohol dehydrogenase [Acidimicrobiaceae bacterium]|nr:NAD(P)-dependent alcohol dehydrogenase [Ilumatobacter sp.]MCB9382662.1 NAD(P)-dependent alcohol dehydrogenase [Acidimicrobiaceae bacterium]MCO5331016.1 NAD(P)-dependent alcohol dehydrogenase [Ilumatobacteraceae bacterium]
MKAFRMVGWKQPFEFQEVPQPDPRPGQVLIKVAAAGLCHSDLTVQGMDPGVMNAELPFTLGHETTGWVEALGDGAKGFEVGQAVAVYGPLGCGYCRHCLAGNDNICDNLGALPGAGWGLGVDGGMAPYMVVDSTRQLAPLGDLDPVLAAPLTDAAVTPYRAIKRSMDVLLPGSHALVLGVGGLGHLAVQILKAVSPATVIAVDAKPEVRAFAAALGADHVLAPGDDLVDQVMAITKGQGIDLTLDIVGAEATLAAAMTLARAGSRVQLIGAAGGVFPYHLWSTKWEVQVSSSMWGSVSDLREVIALAGQGVLRPKLTTFAFDQAPAAYHALHEGTLEGRAVVLPNG